MTSVFKGEPQYGNFVQPEGPMSTGDFHDAAETRRQYNASPQAETDFNTEQGNNAQAARGDKVIKEEQNGGSSFLGTTFKALGHATTDFFNETNKFLHISDGFGAMGIDVNLDEKGDFLDSDRIFGKLPGGWYASTLKNLAQFTGAFVGVNKTKIVPAAGTLFKGISSKYPKIAEWIGYTTQGELASDIAFHHDDPNIANLALGMGVVKDSPALTDLISTFATNPGNETANEVKNILKNAIVGSALGAVLTVVVKGAGAGVRAIKGEAKTAAQEASDAIIRQEAEAVSKAEIEEAAKETANTTVDAISRLKELAEGGDEASRKMLKQMIDDAPRHVDDGTLTFSKGATLSPEEAAYVNMRKVSAAEGGLYDTPWVRRAAELTPDQLKQVKKDLDNITKGKKVNISDPKNPLNLLRFNSPLEIKQAIHFIGKVMQKDLPKNIPLDKHTEELADLLGMSSENLLPKIQQAGVALEDLRGYVIGAKHLVELSVERTLESSRRWRALPKAERTIKAEERHNLEIIEAQEAIHAVAGFKTGTGRLLEKWKASKTVDDIAGQTNALKSKLLNTVMNVNTKAMDARTDFYLKLNDLSKRQARDLDARLKKEDKLFKGKDRAEVEKALDEASLSKLRGLVNYLENSAWARTRGALVTVFINGLLTNPTTSVINLTGNLSAITTSVFERAYAGVRSSGPDGVSLKETGELLMGMWEARRDAATIFGKAFSEGVTQGHSKTELARSITSTISAANFGMLPTGGVSTVMTKALDHLSTIVNWPARLLLGVDEVAKSVNFRGQLHALSGREARRKLGKPPKTANDYQKMADYKAEFMADVEVNKQARHFSEVNAFTNKLFEREFEDPVTGKKTTSSGLTKNIQNAIEADTSGIAKAIVPFFITPANLLIYAGQRLPGINRFSQVMRDEISSPDAAIKALAEAKVATGSLLIGTGFYWGFNNQATGAPPSDYDLATRDREAGRQPYTLYLPSVGMVVNYNNLAPLGQLIAVGANLAKLAKSTISIQAEADAYGLTNDLRDRQYAAIGEMVLGMGRLVTDHHYMRSFALLADAMGGDHNALEKLVDSASDLFLPNKSFYSSLRRGIGRTVDPVKYNKRTQPRLDVQKGETFIDIMHREAETWWEQTNNAIFELLPGHAGNFAKIDLAGQAEHYPGGNDILHRAVNNLLNPLHSVDLDRPVTPWLRRIADLGVSIGSADSIENVKGVKLTNEESHFAAVEWAKLNNERVGPLLMKASFQKLPPNLQREKATAELLKTRKIAGLMALKRFSRIQGRVGSDKRDDRQQQRSSLNSITNLLTPLQNRID